MNGLYDPAGGDGSLFETDTISIPYIADDPFTVSPPPDWSTPGTPPPEQPDISQYLDEYGRLNLRNFARRSIYERRVRLPGAYTAPSGTPGLDIAPSETYTRIEEITTTPDNPFVIVPPGGSEDSAGDGGVRNAEFDLKDYWPYVTVGIGLFRLMNR